MTLHLRDLRETLPVLGVVLVSMHPVACGGGGLSRGDQEDLLRQVPGQRLRSFRHGCGRGHQIVRAVRVG